MAIALRAGVLDLPLKLPRLRQSLVIIRRVFIYSGCVEVFVICCFLAVELVPSSVAFALKRSVDVRGGSIGAPFLQLSLTAGTPRGDVCVGLESGGDT